MHTRNSKFFQFRSIDSRAFTPRIVVRMTFALRTLGLASLSCVALATQDTKKHIEVQFLPPNIQEALHSPDSSHEVGHKHHGHGALPLEHFMKLFPLDIPPHAHVRVIHLNGLPQGAHGAGPVDSILDSILSELSQGFHSDFKPLVRAVHVATRPLGAHPCEADVDKFCRDDHDHGHHHESELHCLGLHASEISESCAAEVQQSLPFMCSQEISRFCPAKKTINMSVLQCLEEQASMKAQLSADCWDSVVATRAVLSKMKTQSVTLVDKRTGDIIRSPASLLVAPFYFTGYLIFAGALGLVLYALWARDDETGFFKSFQRTFRGVRSSIRAKPNDMEMRKTYM